MAHELLVSFLEKKLHHLHSNSSSIVEETTSNLSWTGNRIDFIELLYALQTQKVINNGSLEMKEFATAFGKMFNIELEDSIYRSYHDIKNRKSSRTKFLNTLSETLNNRMEEEEI
jgi:hypothetical protein